MRLQFKQQKFQADAAKAVVDVFSGQPKLNPTYSMERGEEVYQISLTEDEEFTGWANQQIVSSLSDTEILKHIQKIQRANLIEPSLKLEGRYNLTIEMETGVGKTYTYIKTMYELNKAYGWCKFIVVVPSIAIREGVYKTFQMTEDHFTEEYGKKIRYFVYNSVRLTDIDHFASDRSINVMIINSQAFNAKGKDDRRIYMQLDGFRSRRPIDIISETNPIIIIDEPQSVEGKQTKENLKQFKPMLTLRYSATHKSDSVYNMIYRLDAMDAYNQRLVKKISVKGITEIGDTATNSYVFLERINLSQEAYPTATIQFDCKGKSTIRKVTRTVGIGYNLYEKSGQLEEYKGGYVVTDINGETECIEFENGTSVSIGGVIGKISEEQIRRIQIRETILSHIEKEQDLFYKGIKVLSLFFIDEVAHYKTYDATGQPKNGIFANIFEEEYRDIIANMEQDSEKTEYLNYLHSIKPEETHAGYFSIDKKGRITNSKMNNKKERTSDDIDAYDLIMKNKELLLDQNPKRSPVRFIFSHSALREGWDNPNVFQICTLKQSGSDVRKRQEVGRGLRLCVNQDGERMDVNVLGEEVHDINVLTVIASESYDSFARGLQAELAESVSYRPKAVTHDLFIDKLLTNGKGVQKIVDTKFANAIYFSLVKHGYVDFAGALTEQYYEDKNNKKIKFEDNIKDFSDSIVAVLDTIYNENLMKPENARSNDITLKVDKAKLGMPEFKKLWTKINQKTMYVVDFDSAELVQKAIKKLNNKLLVSKVYFKIDSGFMESSQSKEKLRIGESFTKTNSSVITSDAKVSVNQNIKYDLIGKLVTETGLTRKDIVTILTGIEESVFAQFKNNPEEFILKAAALINEEKATAIIQHITYNVLDERYDTDIFTEPTIKGKLNVNAVKVKKHLYDHLVYDSTNEKKFVEALDVNDKIAIYVKLPAGFYISTPVGKYNPDWAIAFYKDSVKHIYFVAETKGSLSSMQLRPVEATKISCARQHFKAISNKSVVYDVVDSYEDLLNKVMR